MHHADMIKYYVLTQVTKPFTKTSIKWLLVECSGSRGQTLDLKGHSSLLYSSPLMAQTNSIGTNAINGNDA